MNLLISSILKIQILNIQDYFEYIIKNNYQKASKVLFTFVSNKSFGQLITITPHSLTMLKTTNGEFSFIEVWRTDQSKH